MPPWQCGRECSGGACLDQVRDLSGPSESIAFVVSAMAAEGGTESIMDDFLRCFGRSLLPSFTEPTGLTGLPTLFSAKSREREKKDNDIVLAAARRRWSRNLCPPSLRTPGKFDRGFVRGQSLFRKTGAATRYSVH